MQHIEFPFCRTKCYNSFSSMLCTFKVHLFSPGNYLETSLIIGMVVMIRVIGVEWTWLGLEWPHAYYVALYTGDIVSSVS